MVFIIRSTRPHGNFGSTRTTRTGTSRSGTSRWATTPTPAAEVPPSRSRTRHRPTSTTTLPTSPTRLPSATCTARAMPAPPTATVTSGAFSSTGSARGRRSRSATSSRCPGSTAEFKSPAGPSIRTAWRRSTFTFTSTATASPSRPISPAPTWRGDTRSTATNMGIRTSSPLLPGGTMSVSGASTPVPAQMSCSGARPLTFPWERRSARSRASLRPPARSPCPAGPSTPIRCFPFRSNSSPARKS